MDPSKRVLIAAAQLGRASYYDLLMVKPGSDRVTLQEGFHKFALAFHPDQHRGERTEVREAATRVFERGVEAYTVLRDPDLAGFYDQLLAGGVTRLRAEDFDRFAKRNRAQQPLSRPNRPKPPAQENAFVNAMKTQDGRSVAQRIERLIRAQRYREAYLQIGLLETLEPDNAAVRERADRIAAYLKQFGNRVR